MHSEIEETEEDLKHYQWRKQRFLREGNFFQLKTGFSIGCSNSDLSLTHGLAGSLGVGVHIFQTVQAETFSFAWFVPAVFLFIAWVYGAFKYVNPVLRMRSALYHMHDFGIISAPEYRAKGILNFCTGALGLLIFSFPASRIPIEYVLKDIMSNSFALDVLARMFAPSVSAIAMIVTAGLLCLLNSLSGKSMARSLSKHREQLSPLAEVPEEPEEL